MSTVDVDHIYALLPAWIRLRDHDAGGDTLRALLGVIASQAEIVDENLDQLYDDQFIETCEPWVIPYIGDLIGFRPLRPLGPGQQFAARAEVANTIGYRRRKGTLVVIEQLADDVTGWPAVAVEFFSRLATTQYVRNHVRLQNAIADVRSWSTADDINTAFDFAPRSVDVRRIASGRGRYNIPNVAVFVWRLHTYGGATLRESTTVPSRLARSTALRIGPGKYTFDPFGGDVPLVNPPQQRAEFTRARHLNLPFPLHRFPLYAELEAWRSAKAAGQPFTPLFFADPPVLVVYEANGTPIDAQQVQICDLTSWTAPARPNIRVAVDPELGRLVFAAPTPAKRDIIAVTHAYAFSGDYGGGTYVRAPDPGEGPPQLVIADFDAADLSAVKNEVVELANSGIHHGDIVLSPDANLLVIRAEDLARSVVDGNVTINVVKGASVTLRGLGIRKDLTIAPGPAGAVGPFTLRLEHCTLRGTLRWPIDGGGSLTVDHSLCGAIEVHPSVVVEIDDSVLDAGSDSVPALSGGGGLQCGLVTTIARSTIFGTIILRELELLENAIVTGVITCERLQAGCIPYSYLPRSSQVPRRYRTQPDLTIDTAITEALRVNPALTKVQFDAIATSIDEWLRPSFTSRVPGQPGYAQLADFAPDEIRFGAEDDDEMGVFYGLFGPRREANLRYRLEEYLRIGLESGIIHAS